jgi:hypothetical protein
MRCIPPTQNQPPVISGVSGPTTLKVNETGTWTVKASDPEQGVLTYSVMWGDEALYASAQLAPMSGGYTQTTTFTHSYASARVYNPTFTVTDNQGLGAKTSISVNVGEVTTPCGGITGKICPSGYICSYNGSSFSPYPDASGTCIPSVKNTSALAPSDQYSASILENMKITLDQIQKAINDWH